MAWLQNFYECDRCGREWTDEWSCMCDDDCPYDDCAARHISPYYSDDLSQVVERHCGLFIVLWPPETAEDNPDYLELAVFPSREQVEAYLRQGLDYAPRIKSGYVAR